MTSAPCPFGIVFALGIEAGGLEALLGNVVAIRGRGFLVRQGQLDDRRIVLVQSGPGRRRAAAATEALLEDHRPAVVVAAGFAGGLDPGLRRGDIVVGDDVVDEGGRQYPIDLPPLPAAAAAAARVGRLLTVDRIIHTSAEKRALGRRYAALAADMETMAVAEVCRRRQTLFLAVRVISDAADEDLPADVEKLLARPSGPARLAAAVGSLLRRPASLLILLRLRRNAREASARLAEFLVGALK
jgi:adenosylhomocysteine nucleosidase